MVVFLIIRRSRRPITSIIHGSTNLTGVSCARLLLASNEVVVAREDGVRVFSSVSSSPSLTSSWWSWSSSSWWTFGSILAATAASAISAQFRDSNTAESCGIAGVAGTSNHNARYVCVTNRLQVLVEISKNS